MCGLVGVAGRMFQKDLKVFKELLYADYLRGMDSTGIGIVTSAHEGRVMKAPCTPEYLLSMKKVDDAIVASSRVLMGHNRAATRGKVTAPNAHPFFTGRILGAHNGTLDFSCLKDLEKNYEGDTDSEQLINTVHTLDGNIAEALKLTSGAWALSIYDVATKRVSLVRNEQRPLYYAMAKSNNTLYWASEAYMLRWVLTRNDIDFNNKIYELPVDLIFSWEVPDSAHIFAEKPDREAAPGKRVQNFHQGYSRENLWESWLEQEDSNAPRGPVAKPGAASYDAAPKKQKRSDLDAQFYADLKGDDLNDLHWIVYGLGWDEAAKEKVKFDNPYTMIRDHAAEVCVWNPRLHEAYRTGFQAYFQYNRDTSKKKDAEKLKPEAIAKAKLDKVINASNKQKDVVKPSDSFAAKNSAAKKGPVGELIDQKEASASVTPIDAALRFPGPAGKKISAAKFEELTGHKCGWCELKFNPNKDNGKFVEMVQPTAAPTSKSKTEMVYVCGECISDPVQQNLIEAENKHA